MVSPLKSRNKEKRLLRVISANCSCSVRDYCIFDSIINCKDFSIGIKVKDYDLTVDFSSVIKELDCFVTNLKGEASKSDR